MKAVHVVAALVLSSLHAHAQMGAFNLGARSAALAGASLTLGDPYSLFNNVGGLGHVEHHAALASYQNRYGIKEFQVVGAGAIYHTGIGNAGLGFYKFGDNLYSEQKLHLAIGNKIETVSIGAAVDVIQYQIATIGSTQALAIQLGGIAEVSPQLRFGAHIFNLNQATFHKETGEKVPTVMKVGISFLPSDELILNAEVEKDLDFAEVFKAGIEYRLIQHVFLRTGISTNPLLGAFGAGFHPKNFRFDYAFSSDSQLGSIHEFSIAYTLQP